MQQNLFFFLKLSSSWEGRYLRAWDSNSSGGKESVRPFPFYKSLARDTGELFSPPLLTISARPKIGENYFLTFPNVGACEILLLFLLQSHYFAWSELFFSPFFKIIFDRRKVEFIVTGLFFFFKKKLENYKSLETGKEATAKINEKLKRPVWLVLLGNKARPCSKKGLLFLLPWGAFSFFFVALKTRFLDQTFTAWHY